MIAYIKGRVIFKQAPVIIIETNGIGYELWVPMSTYYNLPDINITENNQAKLAELYCYNYIREDSNTLYGFNNMIDRKLFTSLIKINGVGPRLALTILSNYNAAEFLRVIENNSLSALVKLPGVGKKTAERLLLELKDKLSKLFNKDELARISLNHMTNNSDISADKHADSDCSSNNINTQDKHYSQAESNSEISIADAIAALEALGYKYSDAHKAVNGAINKTTNNINIHTTTSEQLIKAALNEFR